WLLSPGWFSRAVEGLQQWLADGEEGVIPNFRDAAAAALGERWASTPPGWYDPGGDKPSFVTDDDDDNDGTTNGDNVHLRGRSRFSSSVTTPTMLGRGA
ncbi:unnamed protein product, partial [Pylaiella littoralis]